MLISPGYLRAIAIIAGTIDTSVEEQMRVIDSDILVTRLYVSILSALPVAKHEIELNPGALFSITNPLTQHAKKISTPESSGTRPAHLEWSHF